MSSLLASKNLLFLLFLVQKTYFQRREFSFTLKDDVYVRYLSFLNEEEMAKEIQKRQPYKIDIGAVYSTMVSKISLSQVPMAVTISSIIVEHYS